MNPPEPPDPPPRTFTLKARTFESVNPPAGQAPVAGRIDVQDLLKAAQPGVLRPPQVPPAAPPPSVNDVTALLRDNVAHEVPRDLPPPVRQTRRRTDYLLCLVSGNALIAGLVALLGLNPGTVLFGLAGAFMFTVVLTWVMWFVMDRY
jgi:hypothetical protein